MASPKVTALFHRLDQLELSLCLFFNRASHRHVIERFFAVISRLGDGIFWYCLMLIFALVDYPNGIKAALHMGVMAILGLLLYKLTKGRMVRQRPSITWAQIRRGTAPLDLYSFPSGHTLHAVSFSIIAIFYYPFLAWLLVPFSVLIALSRVILGLHYPSDVAAGATIGGALALLSLNYAF
jgi:undecaprenyl-diphosphatase